MKDFINEFLEYMVGKYKTKKFSLVLIKHELINHFDRKTLMYSYANKWLKNFLSLMKLNGFGKYDEYNQEFILNLANDNIILWMEKYNLKFEDERKENKKDEIEKFDELIK